jgi:hypothetical protein
MFRKKKIVSRFKAVTASTDKRVAGNCDLVATATECLQAGASGGRNLDQSATTNGSTGERMLSGFHQTDAGEICHSGIAR